MKLQSFVFEWKTQYFEARLFVEAENLYMQPTHNLTIPFGSTKLFVYCSLYHILSILSQDYIFRQCLVFCVSKFYDLYLVYSLLYVGHFKRNAHFGNTA